MAITITVNESIKEIAFKEAIRRNELSFRAENSVSSQYKFDMILLACIGELIFQEYCSMHNRKYECLSGELDGLLIKVDKNLFEIKCSGYGTNFEQLNFMYNKEQY